MSALVATALAFAKHGHAVFPLHYPVGADKLVCSCGRLCGRDAAKHPYAKLAKNGVNSATLDTGVIKHWLGYVAPDANLGVACDRLVVLDIDPRHDGDQSLRVLEHECALPETWRTLTGGGGEHIIFSCPDGVNVKNYSHAPDSVPPLGPGIDIRARGGYIVAPPSRHINGRHYEFSVDHHPQDTPLAPLPGWLGDALWHGTQRMATVMAMSRPSPAINGHNLPASQSASIAIRPCCKSPGTSFVITAITTSCAAFCTLGIARGANRRSVITNSTS